MSEKEATFEERSDVAVKCLPDSEYKNCLIRLHNEMLDEIKILKFHKEHHRCMGCWGEINMCDCGEANDK